MPYLSRIILLSCLSLVIAGCSHHQGKPSGGASNMPGAEGTFEFKPSDWVESETTWWVDSDGVNPGVAGCHIGTNEKGVPNGRKFGEACLANGLLVESNPGKGELHSHGNDIGHPDTFDCNAWCVGNGHTSGVCEVAAAPPCEQSARCACD
ncbi:hypothetical protein EDC56_3426 [Sinobacterium caligoides]|uniref:Lipoprotein n=1 Tax=Sinobacterium caligoides TaxID=933926 RepID=A0A3N2DFV7_9GAMM|nr:hypothetical protein [Sinobacterium caligoides]ROR98690.1 hypothetical protein EDC56_3426 [Sinobacterium caligoides]